MTMNRFQRRRWATQFSKAKVESIKAPAPSKGAPCDWPGCTDPWEFVTMATVKGERKPIARRCKEHRLSQKPASE